jgi:hypothetical protein
LLHDSASNAMAWSFLSSHLALSLSPALDGSDVPQRQFGCVLAHAMHRKFASPIGESSGVEPRRGVPRDSGCGCSHVGHVRIDVRSDKHVQQRAATSTIPGNAPPRFDPRAFPYWRREFTMHCMGKNAAELALRNARPIQGGRQAQSEVGREERP